MPLPYPALKKCPCDSGQSYGTCCEPAHIGKTPAPTAEALMRSRYCAFVLQNEAYLLQTWHPKHRPTHLNLNDGIRYTSLTIHHASQNQVKFTAKMLLPDGQTEHMKEHSLFEWLDGVWLYVKELE